MESIQFTTPPKSLFQFPPSNDPRTVPSPSAGSTLTAPPFSIPTSIYNAPLDVKVPITIALVYAVSVTLLNKYNRSHGNKAWPISKTKGFFWFVIAHNVFLAVYSAWTFVGMFNAIRRSIPSPTGPDGIVGTVDGFCKIHGVSGLGNAVRYNVNQSQWFSESPATLSLSADGAPAPTDLGRLWNEGLAFYGWFFYLSKFYEVFDTLIIIAKGKRSSTLQTYHHAGAMMCMWAGIRFMSPPIWLFCFLNSAIHAMMYTYYTLTAFSVHIPKSLKQSLTTMQICQFVIGVAYAATHSFISYTVPIQVLNVEPSIAGVASAASTAVSSVAAGASAAGVGNLVKKLLFRAAGEEGLAENVHGAPAASEIPNLVPENLAHRYRTEYQTVPCIDTSGQTFAIWLNVLYLAPLTALFVRFFVKSYLRRSGKGSTYSTAAEKAERAGKDALKGVGRELFQPSKKQTGSAKENIATGNAKENVAPGSPNGKPTYAQVAHSSPSGKSPNGKAKNGKAR